MALLPWDRERKEETNTGARTPSAYTPIQSVQQSWQPTQASGGQTASAPSPVSYIASEERAQVDEGIRQRQAAAAAQAAAAENARRASAAQQVSEQSQQPSIASAKEDQGWKKYYDEEFDKAKSDLNFFERLIDGGQASRRAELNARNRYHGELNERAFDNQGNVVDQDALNRAQGIGAVNTSVGNENARRSRALGNAIGANASNRDETLADRVKSTVNAIRSASLYDATVGVDDTQKFGLDDIGRFGGQLVQGIATMPIEGAKQFAEALSGRGTNYETGMEDELDVAQRMGRGVAGVLNIVTPFMPGGGVRFVDDMFGVLRNTATSQAEKLAARQVINQILRSAASGAATQGAIGGATAAGEWAGDDNSLLGKDGNIDMDKVQQFTEQVGTAAGLSALGGVAFGGGGRALRALRTPQGRSVGDMTPEEISAITPDVPSGEVVPATDIPTQPTVPRMTPEQLGDYATARPAPGELAPVTDMPTIRGEAPATDMPGVEPRAMDLAPESIPDGDMPKIVDEVVTPEVQPVADGVPVPRDIPSDGAPAPVTRSEQIRQLQESRVGRTQAEEAVINQELRQLQQQTPRRTADDELSDIDARLERGEITPEEHARLEEQIFARESAEGRMIAEDGNLPDEMTSARESGADTEAEASALEQLGNKRLSERFVSMPAKDSGVRSGLASAVGMAEDAALPVREILEGGGITGKRADRIEALSDRLDEIIETKRQTQRDYRKVVADGGDINADPARVRGRLTREEADIMAKLESEKRSLQARGNIGEKAVQAIENIIKAKNTNQLLGAPVERGLTADLIGTAMYTAKNPVAMARSMTQHGNPASSAFGTLKRGWTTPPKSAAEAFRYIISNPYRTAMTPAQIAADMRKGAFRTEFTKWANRNLTGKELTNAQAEKLSRVAGDDLEALVNMGAGVDNGSVNLFRYRKAARDWKRFIETGSEADHRKFMEAIDRQNNLVDAIQKGVSSEKFGRLGASLINGLLPYMRNATNMTVKGVVHDLNPFTLSLIDGIRRDQRGWAKNLALGVKNNAVDYAVLAALGSRLVYNPSDDVDDQGVPPGVSIHMGGDNYFSIRGTPIELPLASIQMAKEIAQDVASGEDKGWQYYAKMVKSSIPYVDYMDSHGNVVESLSNLGGREGDSGYAAKNFAVSNARSLVPFSNNNIQASLSRFDLDGDGSRSMNAKKTYDENPGQWLLNQLGDRGFGNVLPFVPDRDELEDSRDMSGRVRTVNNQGSWMNKQINDENTEHFNDAITDLVKYGRQNDLGKGTQDMFNTYPDGSENSFKSVMDSITFLDVPDGDKPDSANKLDYNQNLADLSHQFYNGFYGDSGGDLLTLGDRNLYSDVSVPGKYGGKNSRLPISVEAIVNSIAQTGLPSDQRNALYEIGQQKDGLYERRKAGEITYDQEQAMRGEIAIQEQQLLRSSEGYQRLSGLMDHLRDSGFFEEDGLGATKSGQTYLWNSLNALIGDKGATPASQYPERERSWGGGRRGSTGRPDLASTDFVGVNWTPVTARSMAAVQRGGFTPVNTRVSLSSAIRGDKSQNYTGRSF